MRRLRQHLRLLLLTVALLAVFVACRAIGLPSSKDLQSWADGLGALAAPGFVLVGVILSCAFVPFPLLAGAAGALLGVATGTPVALAIAVAAAVTQMTIARYVAPPGTIRGGDRLRRANEFLEQRGTLAVFYTRLVPGVPFVALNYAAGVTSLRARHLAAGTAPAMAPRAFAYAALGGTLFDVERPETWIAIGLLLGLAIAGAVLARRGIAPPS